MQREFWIERWQQQQIGFHQNEINSYLIRHWHQTRQRFAQSHVFVPLCGKSLDLLWLKDQGHKVIGIELSPIAVEDFITENNLQADAIHHPTMVEHRDDELCLYCGDFFDLTAEQLTGCHLVFDRAALIALPQEMRGSYVTHLQEILPETVDILLVTLAYHQDDMSGPPFSVEDEEVYQLFQPEFNVNKLEHFDILDENPKFRERGLDRLTESVFHLHR